MSFTTKKNYLGIEGMGLSIRSNSQNATNQTLQIPGKDGSILDVVTYGHIKAPTCEYAITGEVELQNFVLGKVQGTQPIGAYAISKIHISTSAGGEPTFTAEGVQIESGATTTLCTYKIDKSRKVTPRRHAVPFGFTFTESANLTLQACEYEASVNISPSMIDGSPVASDATAGTETVSITMWSNSEETAPTITFTTGEDWKMTSDWTCTGADSSMFVWTATYQRFLPATETQTTT